MAKVSYFSSSVIAGGAFIGLLPNDSDSWLAWAYADGDAITVTAHPGGAGHVRGDNTDSPIQPLLAVENLRVESDAGTPSNPGVVRRIYFDVRNVGNFYVTDYVIGISSINN